MGFVPPFVGVAVKVTLVPWQNALVPVVIAMLAPAGTEPTLTKFVLMMVSLPLALVAMSFTVYEPATV